MHENTLKQRILHQPDLAALCGETADDVELFRIETRDSDGHNGGSIECFYVRTTDDWQLDPRFTECRSIALL